MMDQVELGIIRNALYAIAREMKGAMMRTAASPIIHSGGDASAAIFDADMQLVAQGNDIPTMLGSAVISTAESVRAIGAENLRPGDVIASNDIYTAGGSHLPDVQLTRPVFFDGEVIAYVMTRGHWPDVGGQRPGSYDLRTWDVFGEGLRIPPVVLYREDKPVPDLVRMVMTNTRDPQSRHLDLNAQYSGVQVGDERVVALALRYGGDTVKAAMQAALDYAEARTRAEIEKIPDGTYRGEDFIEPIDAGGELLPVRVAITVSGSDIEFDFEGTAPQVRGGINCPLPVTLNTTWFTVKAITDNTIPINQGCYRPITVKVPEGSLLNASFPASVVSGTTDTAPRVVDMLISTLSQAIPEKVIAQSHSATFPSLFSGLDPDPERCKRLGRGFAMVAETNLGGMGARPDKDGVSTVRVLIGNAGAQSVEYIEHSAPMRVEEWTLVENSGGAGKWRGGLAARRRYLIEFDEASCTVIGERQRVAPKGLFGGGEGGTFSFIIQSPDGESRQVRDKSGLATLKKGDRVTLTAAGSGGYGDPKDRDRARVASDLANGYITADAAEALYGYKEGV